MAETTDAQSLELALDGSAPPDSHFMLLSGPDTESDGRHVALDGELVALGRDVTGAGRFADARMSRLHARCAWDARMGRMRLGDAQSRNGTYVNGARIESVLLSHGDLVRMGDSLLLFVQQERERSCEASEEVARSPLCVLLRGESGTGKELLARQIHEASGRSGPFVAVNCGSLPRELVASELFGHTKGAFSGAGAARRGLFLSAERGTLLLDEIGDCPREAQVSLLRALQERAIRPVGAEHEISVDVRVIAATHQDLERAIAQSRFRADLYARLAQVTIELAPLRARRGQILPLARGFAQGAGRSLKLSADAAEALCLYEFPLNVRELQSLVHAFCARCDGASALDLLYLNEHHPAIAAPIEERRSAATMHTSGVRPARAAQDKRSQLHALLSEHGGNVSKVAEALGKPRAQVYRWMRAYGLSPDRFRSDDARPDGSGKPPVYGH